MQPIFPYSSPLCLPFMPSAQLIKKTKGPLLSSLKTGKIRFFDLFDFLKIYSSRVGQKREYQNFYLIHLIFKKFIPVLKRRPFLSVSPPYLLQIPPTQNNGKSPSVFPTGNFPKVIQILLKICKAFCYHRSFFLS